MVLGLAQIPGIAPARFRLRHRLAKPVHGNVIHVRVLECLDRRIFKVLHGGNCGREGWRRNLLRRVIEMREIKAGDIQAGGVD